MKKKLPGITLILAIFFIIVFIAHGDTHAQPWVKTAATLPPLTSISLHTVQYAGTNFFSRTEPATTEPAAAPAMADGKKLIALTFDDGPDVISTPQVLDVLKKENIKATFFVIGVHIPRAPALVERAAREGHQIASHCWSHTDLTKLTPSALEKEVSDTNALIKKITGQTPTCVRPPLGMHNSAVRQALQAKTLLWSVDPKDWKGPPPEATAAHVINIAVDGDIVVLHDSQPNTAEALKTMIPALRARGFYFVTVDELLQLRPHAAQEQEIRAARPE